MELAVYKGGKSVIEPNDSLLWLFDRDFCSESLLFIVEQVLSEKVESQTLAMG